VTSHALFLQSKVSGSITTKQAREASGAEM
jgi:hypothetical protein